jgi:haloalkane dehalogenase
MLRKLSDAEMAAYREPFLEREDRLPTLVWPRQIPIDREPADVTAIVERYSRAMLHSPLPKLLIVGEPGAIIRGRALEFCRSWPNQTEVTVRGVHFLQEDSPDEIGKALYAFVTSVQRGPGQAVETRT